MMKPPDAISSSIRSSISWHISSSHPDLIDSMIPQFHVADPLGGSYYFGALTDRCMGPRQQS
ncbi:hypothetical protein [Nocardioides immobilis]|uniref:hypothetical protein n=1 Tax=Nocardioides immobilis TaxID=2049295 RepID=UPI0015F9C801|nr:hypothetical protein [Nocardioides immobilis]